MTKEQIEAEGWKHAGTVKDDETLKTLVFDRENYRMFYGEHTNLTITKTVPFVTKFIFDGYCKDVNELRIIFKLLNI